MKYLSKIVCILAMVCLTACVSEKDLDPPSVDDEIEVIEDDGGSDNPLSALNVSSSFDYRTSKNVNLVLNAPDFLKGATFSIFGKIGNQDSLAIANGTFDDTGRFEKSFTLTARMDSVLIYTNYIGLIDNVRLPVNSSEVSFDYSEFYGREKGTGKGKNLPKRRVFYQKNGQVDYTFIDTFNFLGVPDNLALSLIHI